MNQDFVEISSSDSDTDKNSDYDNVHNSDYKVPVSFVLDRNSLSRHLTSRSVPILLDWDKHSKYDLSLPDELFSKSSVHGNSNESSLPDVDVMVHISENSVKALGETKAGGSQASSQESSSSSKDTCRLTVVLDTRLSEEKFFGDLKSSLDTAGIPSLVQELPFPGMVCWKGIGNQSPLEEQILLFLNNSQVIDMVSNSRNCITNLDGGSYFLESVVQRYRNAKVTFVAFGLHNHFRSHKSSQTKEFCDAVSGGVLTQQDKKRKTKKRPCGFTKTDLEEAVVDFQLRVNANFRLLENLSEFCDIIVSFTSSIKDMPQKKAKQQHNFSWHVQGDSMGTVKVGKQMANLGDLWIQHLLQFHQVSKDTALAIATSYPSPQSLLKAYKRCSSRSGASKLLENIQVRRGTSLLATTKRIGSELSYKIHAFLSAEDPDEILHSDQQKF